MGLHLKDYLPVELFLIITMWDKVVIYWPWGKEINNLLAFAERYLSHYIKAGVFDYQVLIQCKYGIWPAWPHFPEYTPHILSSLCVSQAALIRTSSPLRLIPDMKHLFKRHEAQFFRLSLSMVQSFRLAHRWFCLPGGKQKVLGDEGASSTMPPLPLIATICGCFADNK